jgi:hypothetical protein
VDGEQNLEFDRSFLIAAFSSRLETPWLPVGARLVRADLPVGVHDLIVEVVDDIAADRRPPLERVDVNVHRAFGMRARRFEVAAREELDGSGQLEILEAKRVARMQPVD